MNPIVSNGNKFRWKFKNVKNLADVGVFSDKFTCETIDWKIRVCTTTKHNVKYLSLYFHNICIHRNEKNWICETTRTTKLLNQVEKGHDVSRTSNIFFDAAFQSWGSSAFISWSKVFSDGYVENDSILIEVELSFKYYDFSRNIPLYTDITIDVEGTSFFVNRGILLSKSQHFYDLFVNKKSEDTIIRIENVKVEDFRYFIASFYPLFKLVKMKNYKQLIELATKYRVLTLHENCEKLLISKTGIELVEKLKYADQHDYHELMKTCIDSLKTADQIKLLQKSVEFQNFKATTKLAIMSRILDFF